MAAGTSLQLNIYYGITRTLDSNGNFVSSPQINGGTPSNVTMIDGNMGPQALNTSVIPLPTAPYTSFYDSAGGTIGSLNMSGGWLTLTGTLTVTGSMVWTGGYIAGPGTLIVEGGLQLGTGVAAQQEALYGATLINTSTITVGDQDTFAQEYGATVENQGIIDFKGLKDWTGDDTGTIDNQGTIEQTAAGTDPSTISYVTLDNDGAVSVSLGVLDLAGGGSATGIFTAAATTTLEFGALPWAFNSTSSVSGAGNVEFTGIFPSSFNANSQFNVTGQTEINSSSSVIFASGSNITSLGAVTLENGTLDLDSSVSPATANDSAASLIESSGILTGDDTLTVSGALNWTGGVMSGTGTTVAEGVTQLGASDGSGGGQYLTVRTLELVPPPQNPTGGGGTVEAMDTIQQSYGSTFLITTGYTLDVYAGVNWERIADDTSTIDNQGALIVGAGISTATISGDGNFPFLTNQYAISVLSGTLDLACDGTSTSTIQDTFRVAAGCTLQFGGDFTLGTGAGIAGPGIVNVESGGDLWFTSGAFGDLPASITMNIDGGTVQYDDTAEASTLNLSSGDLTGPGTLTVTGTTVWTGGTMDGAGNTIAQGGLQIGLPSDTNDNETLDGRTLTNSGAATWAGGGSFSQLDGATFANQAGASLDVNNGLTWYSNDGTGTIANAGTLLESASGHTTTLNAALDNTGSVQVEQGTLSLQGGGIVGGSYLVLAGATLTFGSDNVNTTTIAVPSDFTTGQLDWAATLSGAAQVQSGSGLASVGVSLSNGTDYYNGTGFLSPAPVYNAAILSGSSWTYSIATGNLQSDQAYAVGTQATDNRGGSDPSTIASVLLAPAPPSVSAVTPSAGPIAGGTTVTITGSALANATAVDFGTIEATIVSDTSTTIVVTSPAVTAAGSVKVTVTTAGGKSATSSADEFTYDAPPNSTVTALPATTSKTSFTVSWSGSDGTGPGIASYSIYVSDNGGAYKPFVTNTTKTSAVFTGQVNNTYAFYSVATDRLGVAQPAPTAAQATTKVVLPPVVTLAHVQDITNKKHQVTEVLVTFSGPVNSTEADSTATYHLATPGKGGSYTAKNAGIIKLRSAVYSGATDIVALTPVNPFTLTKPVQLLVYGTGATTLKDIYGRPIDGGNNLIAILSRGRGDDRGGAFGPGLSLRPGGAPCRGGRGHRARKPGRFSTVVERDSSRSTRIAPISKSCSRLRTEFGRATRRRAPAPIDAATRNLIVRLSRPHEIGPMCDSGGFHVRSNVVPFLPRQAGIRSHQQIASSSPSISISTR